MMTPKQQIQQAVAELPEDCTLEDAQRKLYVLQKIRKGLAELDAGEGVSHDEAKRQVASWKRS